MTRTRKLIGAVLLAAAVSFSGLTAALAVDNTSTYAYLPDHSIYFYDVAAGYSWAHREIDTLAMNGVVKGGGDYLFYPGNPITRADFIVMLDRAYGMSAALDRGLVTAQGSFSDVPSTAYYSKSVMAAKAFGVATGTNDGRFLPKQQMTRQDAMVFLKRTIDRTSLQLRGGEIIGFSDIGQISAYAKESVSALVNAQVISGANGRLNPRAMVTRAEMAVMLYRATHMVQRGGTAIYEKRGDVVNVCVGVRSYCDVVIENYKPGTKYSALMRYTRLWQEDGVTYITLEERQPIDREGVYTAGQLILNATATSGTQAFPVSPGCVAIDVSAPYHQIRSVVSTGSSYRYCYPTVVNGEVTVVYYIK